MKVSKPEHGKFVAGDVQRERIMPDDGLEESAISYVPNVPGYPAQGAHPAERLLDMAETLLRAQAAASSSPEVSAALRVAAMRMRAIRVANELLHSESDSKTALPAFLLQLAAVAEGEGLARVRIECLDLASDLPEGVGSVLGLYAAHKLTEAILNSPPGRVADLRLRLGQEGDSIQLEIAPANNGAAGGQMQGHRTPKPPLLRLV